MSLSNLSQTSCNLKRTVLKKTTLALGIVFLFTGCSANSNPPKPVQLPESEAKMDSISVSYGPSCSGQKFNVKKVTADSNMTIQGIDNLKTGGILLEFGSLPHPGHGYRILEKKLKVVKDKVIVQVQKINPDPNRMYPMVIINPCGFIAMANIDSINKIEVYNETGSLLSSWPNSNKSLNRSIY